MLWKYLYTGLLVACLIGMASCDQRPAVDVEATPVTLKLNWKAGVQFIGFYIAENRGYYRDENLTVTFEPILDTTATADIPKDIISGKYTFATGGLPLLNAQVQGAPIVVFSNVFKLGPEVFFARTETGIRTPRDLAGHRVVVKNAAWRTYLQGLLEHDGLTLADVEEVPGAFDMTPFFSGEVDVWAGFITNEVIRARREGLSLVTLPLSEYGINIPTLNIFTRKSLIVSDPDLVERFLRASLRGWLWAVEHPTQAVDILLEMLPELAAERDLALAAFDSSIPLIRPPGAELGAIDCWRWAENPLLHTTPDRESLCTTAIYEAIRSDIDSSWTP